MLRVAEVRPSEGGATEGPVRLLRRERLAHASRIGDRQDLELHALCALLLRLELARHEPSSGLQVRYPHNCDGIALMVCLLFRVLVAGPNVILLRRPALSLLLVPHL